MTESDILHRLNEAAQSGEPHSWGYPPFVSVSVSQLKEPLPPWAPWLDRHCNILKKEMPRYAPWPKMFPFSERCPFPYKEGSLFVRQHFAAGGLYDFPVSLLTHAFMMIYHGNIIVESPRGLNVLPEGNAALLPAGLYRMTEVPSKAGRFEALILFFRPSLLLQGVQPISAYESITKRIPCETSWNIYQLGAMATLLPQGELLRMLESLPDFMRALWVNGGIGLFSFLKQHLFWQRRWIKERLKQPGLESTEHAILLDRLRKEYFGRGRIRGASEADSTPKKEGRQG